MSKRRDKIFLGLVYSVLLNRFHVEGDVGAVAEAGFECLFDFAGACVGSGERESAVHADVELDGLAAADAAGAQVVGVVHVGESVDDCEDFFLNLVG